MIFKQMRICSNKKMIDQSSQTDDRTLGSSIRHEYCQRCFTLITSDGKSDASTQTCPEHEKSDSNPNFCRVAHSVLRNSNSSSIVASLERIDPSVDQNDDASQEIPTWSSLSDS